MKRSKREENGIIIHFLFYTVLFIMLLYFSLTKMYPQVIEIEDKKKEVKKIYSYIERIEKNGFTYEEFKNLNIKGDDDNKVVTEILKNMTEDFYNDNLVNSTAQNYKDFLDDISRDLKSEENIALVKEKEYKIIKILPTFSENTFLENESSLTDFKFINYIERLIYTFGLSTTAPIGISNLSLLNEFAISDESDSLDSNIFYIPFNLSVKGTKEGIINFLYFAKNVGSISIEDNNIELNKATGFLSKQGVSMILEGDKITKDYNILENQVFDVRKIIMSDYIDSSFQKYNEDNMINSVKKYQGLEEYTVNIELYFYVKGQPKHKLEEFIKGVLAKYNKVRDNVNKQLASKDVKGIKRLRISGYNDTLKQVEKNVVNLRKQLNKKENIELIYKKVIELDSIITPIYNKLEK